MNKTFNKVKQPTLRIVGGVKFEGIELVKLLALVIIFATLSGCAWIALDRDYESSGANYQWQSEFRPGKTSIKKYGLSRI